MRSPRLMCNLYTKGIPVNYSDRRLECSLGTNGLGIHVCLFRGLPTPNLLVIPTSLTPSSRRRHKASDLCTWSCSLTAGPNGLPSHSGETWHVLAHSRWWPGVITWIKWRPADVAKERTRSDPISSETTRNGSSSSVSRPDNPIPTYTASPYSRCG